jgi:cell division protein FtsW (lipid II flippase)
LTLHAVLGVTIANGWEKLPTLAWGLLSTVFSFTLLHRVVTRWDEPILPPLCLLYCIGWFELWRLDRELAAKQGLWLITATLAAVLLTRKLRRINWLERYRQALLLGGIVLLFSALLFGTEVNGAKLWLRFGPLSFQPIEIVKILLVVVLASFWRRFRLWLAFSHHRQRDRLPRRGMLVLVLGWVLGLAILVVQRDLGMALLLIGVLFTLFYVTMGRRELVILGVTAFFAASAGVILVFDHVRIRIRAWWDPFAFEDTDGYQMVQGLYAIADGGPWGRGLFLGRPYLIPEAHNDFILVAISHELGWLTAMVVILCAAYLGYHFFNLATSARGSFRILLSTGLASLWCIGCFIIIGGTTKVIPMTGLTLPFVSYGGSSLLSNVLLVALIAKCGRHGT